MLTIQEQGEKRIADITCTWSSPNTNPTDSDNDKGNPGKQVTFNFNQHPFLQEQS